MPITDEQRQARRQWIGASDVPSILGVGYNNAADIYWSKVQDIDRPENDAMLAGTLFEGGVLDWGERQLGPLRRNVLVAHPSLPLRANQDAVVIADGRPVECKTAGLFRPLQEVWGPDGSSEVPDRVIVQCQAILACTEQELCEVVAFLGGRGFAAFRVYRNEPLVEIIERQCEAFWAMVETRQPPRDITPSIETLKAIRREPKTVVPVDLELVDRWESAKAAAKLAGAAADEAQAAVLTALGTAEGGSLPDGREVTYFEQTRRAYQVAEATFRVLRIRKARSE